MGERMGGMTGKLKGTSVDGQVGNWIDGCAGGRTHESMNKNTNQS